MITALLALLSLAILVLCIVVDVVGLCLGQARWRR